MPPGTASLLYSESEFDEGAESLYSAMPTAVTTSDSKSDLAVFTEEHSIAARILAASVAIVLVGASSSRYGDPLDCCWQQTNHMVWTHSVQ